MKWPRIVGAGVLAVCFTGAMLYAADGANTTPGPGQGRLGQRLQNRPANRAPAVNQAEGVRRLGFILWFLQQYPDVKAAVQDHKAKLDALRDELQALRRTVRDKLVNAPGPDERQQIIDDAKADAGAILTKVVDEAIRHHRTMADLVEKHKDDIVKRAVERIFLRPVLGGPGMGPGNAPGNPPANAPAPPPAPGDGMPGPMDIF